MAFRKFKADHIFTGKEILTGDPILITDSEGSIIDLVDEKDAGEDIETFRGMLTPGFINAHCHLELSHLKGVIPSGTGLVEFVQLVMTKRASANELQLDAMRKAEQELYSSGTVGVGDVCNTTASIPIKQTSKLYWHNFIEVTGFVDFTAEKRWADAAIIMDTFRRSLEQPMTMSFSPHAPYSVSKTLFQRLNEVTGKQLVTIHNQESAAEDQLYKNKSGDFIALYKNFGIDISHFQPTGKSSLQSWLPYFTHEQTLILVHNTFTTQEDLDFIQLNDLGLDLHFCICINANKYIEQKNPPFDLLRKNNCTIIMGTDSYASNWHLNMLEEIKTVQQETGSSIPLAEILKWATINGAKALQLDARLGSFEKRKQPGVVLIDEMNKLDITERSSALRII